MNVKTNNRNSNITNDITLLPKFDVQNEDNYILYLAMCYDSTIDVKLRDFNFLLILPLYHSVLHQIKHRPSKQ